MLIESSGPHENGFTSLRDLAGRLEHGYRTRITADGPEYWRAINAPSRLYTPVIQQLLKDGVPLTNVENITGHGWQKVMRAKRSLRYRISAFPPISPVFEFVRHQLQISYDQLFTIFNCGSGMAVFVPDDASAAKVVAACEARGMRAVNAGVVEDASHREVVIEPLGITLSGEGFALGK